MGVKKTDLGTKKTMIDCKSIILKPDDTISQAIGILNSESLRVVLVSNKDRTLLGVVTDGDIRRALINHHEMNTEISNIMFKNPVVAYIDDSREKILALMKNKDILQVPILDKNNRIIGLETLQNIVETKRHDNIVFLMAGGFGTSLKPLTDDTPKPLLKVGDKPILETIIRQFIKSGFHNFFISVHYKADMVQKYFGNGEKWGVSIKYVYEDQPLGTAGALGLLPSYISDMPIVVMNGDLLTKVDFEDLLKFHTNNSGIATICVRKYDFQVPYGVIETSRNKVTSIVEKPKHRFFINAGIYVLNSSVLDKINGESYLDMTQLLEEKIQENAEIDVFPIHEYWMDIGRVEHFEQAQLDCIKLF